MGTAVAARLGLGLLLLALLSPTQTDGQDSHNATTVAVDKISATPTLVPNSTVNSTLPGHGNSLQSTTALFMLSISLVYVC